DQIRWVGRGQGQAFLAAAGGGDAKLLFQQNGAQCPQNLRLVIDDQDMRARRGHAASVSGGSRGGWAPAQVSGKVKLNAKPSGRFSAQMRPPCASTIPLQMERPSPVP